jgi:hypothetical protein
MECRVLKELFSEDSRFVCQIANLFYILFGIGPHHGDNIIAMKKYIVTLTVRDPIHICQIIKRAEIRPRYQYYVPCMSERSPLQTISRSHRLIAIKVISYLWQYQKSEICYAFRCINFAVM